MTVDLVKLYRSARCKDMEQLDPLFGGFIGSHQPESKVKQTSSRRKKISRVFGAVEMLCFADHR